MNIQKRWLSAPTILACALASPPALVAAAELPLRVVLVGDSTVNDNGGWGAGFTARFGPQLEIENLALNGRSSRSFRGEGAWNKALDAKPAYVLIQFGHNDVPGKGPDRETDAATTYRENLIRYVDEARAANATPILVTSIVRRLFGPDGKISPDSLDPYVAQVRRIADEKKVALIDLNALTRRQAEALGPIGSEQIGRKDSAGKLDTTHLGPFGRRAIGSMAAEEFVRVAPSLRPYLLAASSDLHVIVAQDGSGDFGTIQYAVDHSPPASPAGRLIIEIRPGTYHERITVPQNRPRVTLLGQDPKTTVIAFGMDAKTAGGTFFSSTVDVEGPEFQADNVTFQNTFGVGSQAVALTLHSDRAILRNCRLLGWQDTLFAASGRQFFSNCYIEGHVDFIFGDAAAVFQNCEIHSLAGGFIAAQSRLSPDSPTGFIFDRCRLTAAPDVTGVFLARPWRMYSRVVYLDCWMGAHIHPEGWDNWDNPANEATAWFAEAGSKGPGAQAERRASWARHPDREELVQIRPERLLCGQDEWRPWDEPRSPLK